jgi:hypothetical protein
VRVHRGERVVGDEDVGVRVERARDRDALLLAAAQRDAALADLVCSATSHDEYTQPGMSRRRARGAHSVVAWAEGVCDVVSFETRCDEPRRRRRLRATMRLQLGTKTSTRS